MDQNKSGIDTSGEVDGSAARVWTGFGKSRWLQNVVFGGRVAKEV